MLIYKQRIILRVDLINNRKALFLFEDNEERIGYSGQAKEMRGEPNAVGIAIKYRPGNNKIDFWYDDKFDEHKLVLIKDMQRAILHLANGGIIVIPDGFGIGLSSLPELAPKTFRYLETLVKDIHSLKIVRLWADKLGLNLLPKIDVQTGLLHAHSGNAKYICQSRAKP